jgi:outer membrane lipoprotein carrier protein
MKNTAFLLLSLIATIATAVLVTIGSAAASSFDDPEQIARKVQERYARIEGFTADFKQVYRSRDVELQESGIVMMKKPGKMYWEYKQPDRKYFISDGDQTYFFVPADRQVMVSDLHLETASTPLLFLLGKGDAERDFRIQAETEDAPFQPGNRLLRLDPREPHAEFSHLLLEVIPDSLLIHRLTVFDHLGSRNDYTLTNFKVNPRIPDRQFRFRIPSDAEVIRQ